jgi:hypothetical protein
MIIDSRVPVSLVQKSLKPTSDLETTELLSIQLESTSEEHQALDQHRFAEMLPLIPVMLLAYAALYVFT